MEWSLRKCYCGIMLEDGKACCDREQCVKQYKENYEKSFAPFFPYYTITLVGFGLIISALGISFLNRDPTLIGSISVVGLILFLSGQTIRWLKERKLKELYPY